MYLEMLSPARLVNRQLLCQMLALVQPHQGGLLPLSLGLLHPQEIIREYTVDIFNELRQYPVSFPFPPIFVSSHPTSVSDTDRGSIPPIFESLPEIHIREVSSGAESQDDERAEPSVSTGAPTPNRSHLCGENTFKPQRIEPWWWLSGVPWIGRWYDIG